MTAAATRPPCRKGSASDSAFTPSAYARAERCRRQTPERAQARDAAERERAAEAGSSDRFVPIFILLILQDYPQR
ncbi:hypothetical protein HMPREF0860_2340 [Treponema socranskii subsp. socranskii VPI DR56BR1116 = ATCC 35536]|uniref:Lipoprotein n=1 Tax=Treponema socranskii subsp. socranskii VPI DR56BR1116 = ATCC 35536 TaxID=1125725 RepID=A0ABP2YNA6_TRESO|nr:hypothetical protein HMPREF0860_2340 [Treponema socranskii subsp. socranskii VPI DR56BR1116 = ATCC 35536]